MNISKGSSIPHILILLCLVNAAPAQRPAGGLGNFNGTISGHVLDADYREPIEYANVIVYEQEDRTQVTGTITDPAGRFQITGLRPGTYIVEISFIGYETSSIDNVRVTMAAPEINIGNLSLKATILSVEGTEVVGERAALTYEIDKKVVQVSQQHTTVSGSAVDVLENVPSVNVDIEGNVSLRGSENFTVLIDGRPTLLEPSDALQQIPANMIESIEIITNPSARYDPEGISGIINVIMKKKRTIRGISGTANVNIGLSEKYGGDLLVSHRMGIAETFFSGNYSRHAYSGTNASENTTTSNDTISFVTSDGENEWIRNPYGGRGGIDLNLGARDKLSIGGRYGVWQSDRAENLAYEEWSEPGTGHTLYTSQEDGGFSHLHYSLTLDHSHQFSVKDHTLSLQTLFSGSEGDHSSLQELFDTAGTILSGQQSVEEGPSTRLQGKLDYTLPIRTKEKIEAGVHTTISRSEETNQLYEYDTLSGEYLYLPQFSHTSKYNRNVHALYGLLSGSLAGIGYKGGLRSEYTDRLIEMIGEDEDFTIKRWDFFPTIHLSYKFTGGQQLMASYTRRIQRPRSWWLEPFLTWSDPFNVHTGNPSLKPEYINSYEVGFQTLFGKSLFSMETYYRHVYNEIERVQSLYSENVILHTVENIGSSQSLGVETMLDLKLTKWWSLNCTGSLYKYWLEGVLYGDDISEESNNWRARFSSEFKPLSATKIQINGRYSSPRISAQGQRQGFFMTDAALKQEFFKKQLSITLQVRNIFGTGRFEFTSAGEDFSSHRVFTREAPVVMFSINYTFNNYQQEHREETEQEFEGMEEM